MDDTRPIDFDDLNRLWAEASALLVTDSELTDELLGVLDEIEGLACPSDFNVQTAARI